MASCRPPSPEALALLDAAACGLMQTTDDGRFIRANQMFCAWVDRSVDELVSRWRFQDLLTMGGRIFHQTHWVPLLRIQGSVSEVKFEVVRRDGTRLPMMINAIRRTEDGVTVHEIAAFVAHDRDKYERELVLSRKRLEVLVAESTRLQADAKDRATFAEQMIGIVSHDLRTPLSVIAMGAEILVRKRLPDELQSTLSRIQRAVARANRLLMDLLDFTQARLGTGLAVTFAPVDLHQLIAEAADEFRLAYPGRALQHHQSGEGSCTADADRMAQLVSNLVVNAMTYSDPATPVTLTTVIHPAQFSVAVHNDGVPISPDVQAILFEPMTRAATAGREGRSVGLGLYIVREIVRAHRGTISLTSTEETGTTFTAVFPRT